MNPRPPPLADKASKIVLQASLPDALCSLPFSDWIKIAGP